MGFNSLVHGSAPPVPSDEVALTTLHHERRASARVRRAGGAFIRPLAQRPPLSFRESLR